MWRGCAESYCEFNALYFQTRTRVLSALSYNLWRLIPHQNTLLSRKRVCTSIRHSIIQSQREDTILGKNRSIVDQRPGNRRAYTSDERARDIVLNRLVGRPAESICTIADMEIKCLIDTGAQVTIIQEEFFNKNFKLRYILIFLK